MNDMKKRALSLLMSIALALTLLPTGLLTLPAAADEGNPVYTDGQYEADEVSMTGKNQTYTLNETLIVKAGIDYGGTGGHDVRYLARSGNLFETDDTTASYTLPATQNGMEITAKKVAAIPATNSGFEYCLRGKPVNTGTYTFTWTEKYNNVDRTPNEPNYSCTFILKVTVQANPYGDKAPEITGVKDSYTVNPGADLSIDWNYTPYCEAPVGYSVGGPLGRGLSFAHGEDKTIVVKAKSIDAFPSGTKWPIEFTTQYWLSHPTYATTKEITVNNGIETAVPALKLNLPADGEYKTRSSAVIDDSDSKGFAIYNQQWYEADGKTEQSGAFVKGNKYILKIDLTASPSAAHPWLLDRNTVTVNGTAYKNSFGAYKTDYESTERNQAWEYTWLVYYIVVTAGPAPAFSVTNNGELDIPAGNVGVSIQPVKLVNSICGGTKPYDVRIEGLPKGLSLSNWIISGAPTEECKAGTATLVVTDNSGEIRKVLIHYGAVGPEIPNWTKEGSGYVRVSTWDELKAECEKRWAGNYPDPPTKTISVMADITQTGGETITLPAGTSVKLDLNGHTVSNTVSDASVQSMFYVPGNHTSLTVVDTSDSAGTLKFVNTADSSAALIKQDSSDQSYFYLRGGKLQAGDGSNANKLISGMGLKFFFGGETLSGFCPDSNGGLSLSTFIYAGTFASLSVPENSTYDYSLQRLFDNTAKVTIGGKRVARDELKALSSAQDVVAEKGDPKDSPYIFGCAYPAGTVGSAYPSYTPQAEYSGAGSIAWSWSAKSGSSLPTGLTMDPKTGALIGTPTATGSYTVVVAATADGKSGSQNVTLTISAPKEDSDWDTFQADMQDASVPAVKLTADITAENQDHASSKDGALIKVAGSKTLDLNGYTLTVSTKTAQGGDVDWYTTGSAPTTIGGHELFYIGGTAALRVTDGSADGKGAIKYTDKTNFYYTNAAGEENKEYWGFYGAPGIMFDVDAGSLVIDSGSFTAGDDWTHRQHNGVAVWGSGGSTRILGGTFTGRYAYAKSTGSGNQAFAAYTDTVKADSCGVVFGSGVTIAGGTFIGQGGADAVRLGSGSAVYSGVFRTESKNLFTTHNENGLNSANFTNSVRGQSLSYNAAQRVSDDSRITYGGTERSKSYFTENAVYEKDASAAAAMAPTANILHSYTELHPGVDYVFTVTARPGAGGDLSYQWYDGDSQKIVGAVSRSYTLNLPENYAKASAALSCIVTEKPSGLTARAYTGSIAYNKDPVGPTLYISPTTATVEPGSTLVLRAVVLPGSAGRDNLGYKWTLDGAVDETQTGADFTMTAGVRDSVAEVKCTVTDKDGKTADATAKVTAAYSESGTADAAFPTPPKADIIAQPAASQNLTQGGQPSGVGFDYTVPKDNTQNVTASAQWYKRSSSGQETAIDGQTGKILPASVIDTSVTGVTSFFARVTTANQYGITKTADTGACTVTVLPSMGVAAPVFTQNLDCETSWTYGTSGNSETLKFTVKAVSPNAASGGTLSYQWYRSTDGTNSVNAANTPIEDDTHNYYTVETAADGSSSTLQVTGAATIPMGVYKYFCVATNTVTADGTTTAKSAASGLQKLTVTEAPYNDNILIQVDSGKPLPNPSANVQGGWGGPASTTLKAAPASTASAALQEAWEYGEYTVRWYWIDNILNGAQTAAGNTLTLTSGTADTTQNKYYSAMKFDQMKVWCDIVHTVDGVTSTDTREVTLTTDEQSRTDNNIIFNTMPVLSMNNGQGEMTVKEGENISIPVSLSNAQSYTNDEAGINFSIVLYSWNGTSFTTVNDGEDPLTVGDHERTITYSNYTDKELTADPSVVRYFVIASGKAGSSATDYTFSVEPLEMEYYVAPAKPEIYSLTGFKDYYAQTSASMDVFADSIQYLEVKASEATPGAVLNYQWESKAVGDSTWAYIPGATQASYQVPATAGAAARVYHVVVTSSLNGINSDSVASKELTVNVVDRPEHIALPPVLDNPDSFAPQRVVLGAAPKVLDATAKVTSTDTTAAASADKLTYEWQIRAGNEDYWTKYTAGTGTGTAYAKLKPDTATPGTTYYRCIVTNDKSGVEGYTGTYATASVYSDVAAVTVYTQDVRAPIFTGGNYTDGSSAVQYQGYNDLALTQTYSAKSTDAAYVDGDISYQWYAGDTKPSDTGFAEGTPISGATGSTLSLNKGQTALGVGTKWVYCKVTSTNANATGAKTASVWSAAEKVEVWARLQKPETPAIKTQPQNVSYSMGDAAAPLTCEAAADIGDGLSYNWYLAADSGSYENAKWIGSGSSYTPSTANTGSFRYFCAVSNTLAAASVSAFSDPAYSRIASVTVGRNNEQVGVSGPKVTMEAGSGGTVALGGGTVGFSINGNEISYAAVNPVFSGTPTVSGDEIFSAAPTFDAETGILSYSLSGSAQNGQNAVVDVTASSAFYSGVSYVPVTITVGKATAVTASGKLTMWSDSAALILLYPGSATDEEIRADLAKTSQTPAYSSALGVVSAMSDGARWSQPFSFPAIVPGAYRLVVEKPGHALWISPVTQMSGQDISVSLMPDITFAASLSGSRLTATINTALAIKGGAQVLFARYASDGRLAETHAGSADLSVTGTNVTVYANFSAVGSGDSFKIFLLYPNGSMPLADFCTDKS